MKFKPGPDHPRWRGGKRISVDGYVRITSGPYRDWWEHRAVVARCLAENTISPGIMPRQIPEGWEIHHMDFDRRHNCLSNLLLLHPAFHSHARRVQSNANGKRAKLEDLPEEFFEGEYKPWR